jgi:VIT1/CCC1 family predicted Fe2+/Mn2+ transporter
MFQTAIIDIGLQAAQSGQSLWHGSHVVHSLLHIDSPFSSHWGAGAVASRRGAVTSNRQRWLNIMMRFELGLEEPDPKQAPISAGTIAAAYLVGGLIPLATYMLISDIPNAFA